MALLAIMLVGHAVVAGAASPEVDRGQVLRDKAHVNSALARLRDGEAVVVPLKHRKELESKLLGAVDARAARDPEWFDAPKAIGAAYRLRNGRIERWVVTQTETNLPADTIERDLREAAVILSASTTDAASLPKAADTGSWSLVTTRGVLTWNYSGQNGGSIEPFPVGRVERQWAFWKNTSVVGQPNNDIWLQQETHQIIGAGGFNPNTYSNAAQATGTVQLNTWAPNSNGGNESHCSNASLYGFSWQVCAQGYKYYPHSTSIGQSGKVWWNLQAPLHSYCRSFTMPNPTTWNPAITFWVPSGQKLTVNYDHTAYFTVGGTPCNQTPHGGFDNGSWSIQG